MDKLNPNKTLLLIALLLFLLPSCNDFKLQPSHTEVICHEAGIKMLIRHTTSADFWRALEEFDKIKKERGTNENYVVLIFKNKHSMQIKGIKSEEMLQGCVAGDVNWHHISHEYTIY